MSDTEDAKTDEAADARPHSEAPVDDPSVTDEGPPEAAEDQAPSAKRPVAAEPPEPPVDEQAAAVAEVEVPDHPTPQTGNADSLGEGPLEADEAPLEELMEAFDRMSKEFSDLGALVRERSKSEEVQREAFERLHSELRDYKENFLQKALEPMYRSLVSLADSMDEIIAEGSEEAEDVDFLRAELLEALNRYAVEPFSPDTETFDPKTQKVIKTVPTDEEARHRGIATRLHPGYRSQDRIIRPEQVNIYVYTPTPATEERDNSE